METILDITETTKNNKDGFKITTDKQEIFFGISNGQCCCEDWGYFTTNDTCLDFIGANLLGVKIVDECLNSTKNPEVYEGGVMFVNFETNKGTLQFTAYNNHNGYYGHEASLESQQLTVSEYL